MEKSIIIFGMICLLALIPIQAEALEVDTEYVYISSTMFILFTTNEAGFELIDGGLFKDNKWKTFDTENNKMFSFDENLNLMFAAGSFEGTNDQYVLSMRIDSLDNGSVTMYVHEHETREMSKHQNEGSIYWLFG